MISIDEIRTLDEKKTYTLKEVSIILRLLDANFGARVGDVLTPSSIKKAKKAIDKLRNF